MATVVNTQTMSDAELIGASRAGDPDAYAELYRRHVDSARAAARALCRNRSDADDVVSEAFVKMLRVLQSGNGPEVAFRPYLLTAVRNCFYDRTRRKDNDLAELPADDVNLTLIDSNASDDDKALAAAAFATLPERWQLVLWHTEVEGKSPAEVAPLLGLAPNAVAALAYRAREGLRQAFLQAHLRTPQPSDCQECAGSLGAYVRDGLSARDRRKVDDHLSHCDACKALLVELTDTNTTLRVALIPAIVGVPVAAYLSGLGGKGLVAWFLRMPRHQQAGTGAAAAAVVAVVAAAVVSAGGTVPGVAAPSTTRARAAVTTVVDTSASSSDTAPSTISISSTPFVTTPSESVPVVVAPTAVVTVAARPVTTLPKATPTTRVTPTTPSPTTPAPTTPATDAPPAASTTAPSTVTTVAPTTTIVPVVPKLTLTSTQLGSAITGGQARVRLDVAANALPANGLEAVDSVASVKAFANVVVSIPMPAGVTVQSTDNQAWSCTATGDCTVAALAAGGTSTAVVIINVSATVASPISFAPTITTPPGAVIQSQPITLTPVTVPGLQFQEFAHGSVTAIGNTVLTCSDAEPDCAAARAGTGTKLDRFDFEMQFIGADPAAGILDASSADLSITGTVVKALLVWSGEGKAIEQAPVGSVKLTSPAGVTTAVTAAKVTRDYTPGLVGEYVATADVTSLVTAGGAYTVSDIQATTDTRSYAGWSLLVVSHDAAQPERMLMLTAPVAMVDSAHGLAVTMPGTAGATTRDAHAVVSAFEGDRGDKLRGDTAKLSGAAALADAFGGRLAGTRTPPYDNNFGVDVLDIATSDVGAKDVSLTVDTADDNVMVAVFGIALDLA